MQKATLVLVAIVLATIALNPAHAQPQPYQNFDVAIYSRVYEVLEMDDLDWLRERFDVMQEHLHVDKVYLETHRDTILAPGETLEKLKQFFAERGVQTSGGITLTINERNRFETFCYSNPEHRAWVQHVVEHTARHFDELILDDFFFTSCKSDVEIEARGDRSWTDYRLELLSKAATELVIEPARAVNPDIRVVVKYPNWYEHFHGLGFNLETQPALFDAVYTGTETRDAVRSAQHLQPYLSYQIFRYFENLKPGGNGGGWVDTGGMRYLDRYMEQLFLTALARAPEITLFDFRQLQRPIRESDRPDWAGTGTSFDFDAVVAPFVDENGKFDESLTIARAAAVAFEQADRVLSQLGEPTGITSYKPYHSNGEDFLHNFIGMVGIPIDLKPEFDEDAPMILLTETAKHDPQIVDRIERRLRDGKDVVITSGLLRALQDRGIDRIADVRVTERRALVEDFIAGWGPITKSREPILIPQIEYFTNDSWELIYAVDGPMGWPILHDADYGNGHLYIWTIPDNYADLYDLPSSVLNRIRQVVMRDHPVSLEGPAEISLFTYDDDGIVVESFVDSTETITIVAKAGTERLVDLESGEVLTRIAAPGGPGIGGPPGSAPARFETSIKPHSYRAFRLE